MILLSIGAGLLSTPLMLMAVSGVSSGEAGVASGLFSTTFMLGGALGLAVLTRLTSWRTNTLAAGGAGSAVALNGGYHLAFAIGACSALAAAVLATVFVLQDLWGGAWRRAAAK
jgi:hypothetical protein